MAYGAGIVEPLPEFFGAYARMCGKLRERLIAAGVEGRVIEVFEMLQAKSEIFQRCAGDQLAGRDTSCETPFVIADVCFSTTTREVLHAASGPFHQIAVLYEHEGKCVGAVGYVGSYYEIVEPNMGRITDEEWRLRATSDYLAPDPPEWLAGIYQPESPARQQMTRRLRELEQTLQEDGGAEAEAAVDRFVEEQRNTEWAPAAILVLGRYFHEHEEYARAAEVLGRAEQMYGGAARDAALKLKDRCEWRVRSIERQAARVRELEQALEATEPREGLSREQDIERQNKRALALIKRASPFRVFDPGPEQAPYLQQLIRECPDSGYVPVAKLGVLFAEWGGPWGATGPDPAGYAQLAREQMAAFRALATEYPDSMVGYSAAVAEASLYYIAGDLLAAYQKLKALKGTEPPQPDPYPLSVELLEHSRMGSGGMSRPQIDPSYLRRDVVNDLLVKSVTEGDTELALELAAVVRADRRWSRGGTEELARLIDYAADEPVAMWKLAALIAEPLKSRSARSALTVCTERSREARQIAHEHPGGKVAPTALYRALKELRGRLREPDVAAEADEIRAELARDYPDSVENLVTQVNYLSEQNRYEEAIKPWDALARKYPNIGSPEGFHACIRDGVALYTGNPREGLRRQREGLNSLTERFGPWLEQAGLDEKFIAEHRSDMSGIARELIRRVPESEAEILEACGETGYIWPELAEEAIERAPDAPLAYELSLKLGTHPRLARIIAAGPQVPEFEQAVELFRSVASDRDAKLHAQLAMLKGYATKHAGTPLEALALAETGRAYVQHERPERAVEFLEDALTKVEEGRLLRKRISAALQVARQRVAAKRLDPPRKLWEIPASSGEGTLLSSRGKVLLHNGRLYLGTRAQTGGEDLTRLGAPPRERLQTGKEGLACLDAASGALVWDAPHTGRANSLIVRGDRVIIANSRGGLVCLNAATGEQIWQRSLGLSQVGQVWCAANAGAIVASWDQGLLCGVDSKDGRMLWQRDGLFPAFPPVIHDGVCVVWDAGAVVRGLRVSDGGEVWHCDWHDLLSDDRHFYWERFRETRLLVTGGRIITRGTALGDERTMALAADTGVVLWSLDPEEIKHGGVEPFAALSVPDVVLAGTNDRRLVALDGRDGKLKWVVSDAEGFDRHLLCSNGSLLVLTRNDQVVVIDLNLGEKVADLPIDSVVAAEFTADGLRVWSWQRGAIVAWELTLSR